MTIAIIDYEAGNTGSIQYALEQCGFKSYIAKQENDLTDASHIILPGVGSFNKAIRVLRNRRLDIAIRHAVLERKTPFLGICLGMQLLATKGDEGGETEGLDLIPGEIKLLTLSKEMRLPHVGWNEVHFCHESPILKNVISGADFYFLHSYHFVARSKNHVVAYTNYGCQINSILLKDNIMGVQFHPEKSGKIGRQLLTNFATSEIYA
jgi:glutamine amidotransferase